jgi:WD40 repeat protein
VTGYSQGWTSSDDYATLAYSAATGKRLWAKRYNGPGNNYDNAWALRVSPDGSTVFVTGGSDGSGNRSDYATVAYSASTGAQLWVMRYDGPAGFYDLATALDVSPDGSILFVTGDSGRSTGDDYATLAYDASTGSELWVTRYDGANQPDGATALKVSPDGSTVFVTGFSDGSTGFPDFATVAYDASTGGQVWVTRYDGPGSGSDGPAGLGVSPNGSPVFVTGASIGSGSSDDYATLAYDASTGAEEWLERYNGPANSFDEATALGVSPDGSTVFVTGLSIGSLASDYATLAYDASSGAELWVKRYDGPAKGDDQAHALGVSPDGFKLFVTGFRTESTSGFDYATIAYGVA